MSFKVTKNDLVLAVQRLNGLTKRKYELHGQYNGYRLAVIENEEAHSINWVGYQDSKTNYYYILHTLINLLECERKA